MLDLIPKLHRASHAIALLIANVPEVDLSQAEAQILASLHAHRSSTINDLHATFGHRRSTLTSVLDRLERRGLIKRSVNDGDRRVVQVALTTTGKRLALRAYTLLSDAESHVRKRFSAAEIDAFCKVSEAFVELSGEHR
jgi:DNA-binding MarR family transcriptional regulator